MVVVTIIHNWKQNCRQEDSSIRDKSLQLQARAVVRTLMTKVFKIFGLFMSFPQKREETCSPYPTFLIYKVRQAYFIMTVCMCVCVCVSSN
jgi:hypothetical protein